MRSCYYLVGLITLCCGQTFGAVEDEPTPVFTLSTIEVTAEEPIEITATGNRIGLEPLDSAESSTVIDSEITDDQQAINVDEILKNDASISNRGNFGSMSNFTSRGFELSDNGNYLRNGLLYFFFDTPPIESIDRVEILKGPASFLYGSGRPGGMINFIMKKPITDDDFIQGGAQTGSWDYYRAYTDVNQTYNDLDFRTNLALENTHSFRDVYFQQRQLVDFSVVGDTFQNTETWFNVMYQNTNQPQDTGLVAIGDEVADLPRNAYLNQDWTKTELASINATLDSYTDLMDDWTLHSALYYQFIDRDRILSNLRMSESSTGNFQYSSQHRLDTWNFYTALFELMSSKELLGIENKLLFGITYDIMDQEILETDSIISDTYSIYDPPTLDEPDFGDFNDPINVQLDNFGIYGQDVLQLTQQWELILGARFDSFWSESSHAESGQDTHTSPHIAVVFKALKNWSIYSSYTEGFEYNEPVDNINAINFGEPLAPTISSQIEIGTKMELLERRLLLSAAVFDITLENQPVTEDVEDGEPGDVIVVQRGEQFHKGLELGAQGRFTDEWTIISTLMWLDARFSDDDPSVAGNRPGGVPEIAATLWNEYRFPEGKLKNYAINAGAFYEGNRYGDSQNSFELGSYTRYDAGIAYYYPINESELAIRLNFQNLSDETYYSSYRRTNVTVGGPRSAWLTFELN